MIDYLESIASMAGQVTIIGTLLITVYKYLIARPAEKRKERREKERDEALEKAINRQNEPLSLAINKLMYSMEKREEHDDKLDEIAESNAEILRNHEQTLDKHNERLIVLEVINGVRKQVRYVEDSREDNNGNNIK